MKLLFVVIYTVISMREIPCPAQGVSPGHYGLLSCGVYHGAMPDTSQVEVITMDHEKVKEILREYPGARVDTFLVTPFSRH